MDKAEKAVELVRLLERLILVQNCNPGNLLCLGESDVPAYKAAEYLFSEEDEDGQFPIEPMLRQHKSIVEALGNPTLRELLDNAEGLAQEATFVTIEGTYIDHLGKLAYEAEAKFEGELLDCVEHMILTIKQLVIDLGLHAKDGLDYLSMISILFPEAFSKLPNGITSAELVARLRVLKTRAEFFVGDFAKHASQLQVEETHNQIDSSGFCGLSTLELSEELRRWGEAVRPHDKPVPVNQLNLGYKFQNSIDQTVIWLEFVGQAALALRLQREFRTLLRHTKKYDDSFRSPSRAKDDHEDQCMVRQEVCGIAYGVANLMKTISELFDATKTDKLTSQESSQHQAQGKENVIETKPESKQGRLDEGVWTIPMSKAQMRKISGIESPKKFNTWANHVGMLQAGNRQLWRLRLDKLDAPTRSKFEQYQKELSP